MRSFFTILILCSTYFTQLSAQNYPTRYLSDLLIEAIKSEDSVVTFSNINVSIENLPMIEYTQKNYRGEIDTVRGPQPVGAFLTNKIPSLKTDSLGRPIINKSIVFNGITSSQLFFEQLNLKELSVSATNIDELYMDSLHLKSLKIESEKISELIISDCFIKNSTKIAGKDIDSFKLVNTTLGIETFSDDQNRFQINVIKINGINYARFANNIINSRTYYNLDFEMSERRSTCVFDFNKIRLMQNQGTHINIFNCDVVNLIRNQILINLPSDLDNLDSANANINEKYINSEKLLFFGLINVGDVAIDGHQDSILGGNSSKIIAPLTIRGEIENLLIVRSNFNNGLIFNDLKIADRLEIRDCYFNGDHSIGMYNTILPELFINVNWKQLSGRKMYILSDMLPDESGNPIIMSAALFYYGKTLNEMKYEDRFRELVAYYNKFKTIYRDNGDITAANKVYREIQELYTLRYNYLAVEEGGLKNHFKWRLNQLLDFYIDYGTEPAKALVISFYIIIGFGIFYFFFPSDWDVTSKQRLLTEMKSAINKNEPGTAKALLKSSGYLLLSFVNAFTLSLNSFVTLGFGTIPTTGLARYVCIIQGFIGWFLLSLFSVALINQVIF